MIKDHAARHNGAKEEIKGNLNRNGRRSYASLEKAVNNWCSKSTIVRYLKSFDDYITYSQNVCPFLSEGNRIKQVQFSQHVRNRWGLGDNQKILWTMRCRHRIIYFPTLPINLTPVPTHTHSDEKWFYSLVARTFAKACESLGTRKQTFPCQHKPHITMSLYQGRGTWYCGILF